MGGAQESWFQGFQEAIAPLDKWGSGLQISSGESINMGCDTMTSLAIKK
jgi:hypothetical protein